MQTSFVFDWVAILWFSFVGLCMVGAGVLILLSSRREEDWGVRLVFSFCGFAIVCLGLVTVAIAIGGFDA